MTAQLLKFPVRLGKAQEAELRARSGEVAAAYAAPRGVEPQGAA